MGKLNRREFIGRGLAVSGVLAAGGAAVEGVRRSGAGGAPASGTAPAAGFTVDPSVKSPTDRVRLGRSGLKVSLVGVGTGSIGYAHHSNQTLLGQEEFTRMVRHAYDRGIRFFETSESYRGMPEMLGIALKGVPRDSYRLMTKYTTRYMEDPLQPDRCARLLKSVADPERLRIIQCLREGPKNVSELAALLGEGSVQMR